MDCLFCKIASSLIPATIVYRDDQVVAFKDISPAAPQHILIIPVQHIARLAELEDNHDALMGKIVRIAGKLAEELGFQEQGYRLVSNCNDDGGQTVYHIHFHLLGGRKLSWPPG